MGGDRYSQIQARQDFEHSCLQYDEAVRNKDYHPKNKLSNIVGRAGYPSLYH